MNIQINSLTNANVYIDGIGFYSAAPKKSEIPQPRQSHDRLPPGASGWPARRSCGAG